jgi:hypothetical protein
LLVVLAEGGADALELFRLKAQVCFEAAHEMASSAPSVAAETSGAGGLGFDSFLQSLPAAREIARSAPREKHDDKNRCRFSLNPA